MNLHQFLKRYLSLSHDFSAFLYLAFTVLLIAMSCSKDNDLFESEIVNDSLCNFKLDSLLNVDNTKDSTRLKTITFFATDDAYLSGQKGIDDSILRLKNDVYTTYLKFDLNRIQGNIHHVYLELSSKKEHEKSQISVYRASTSEWEEKNLTLETAPKIDSLLSLCSRYSESLKTRIIKLDASQITTTKNSFIIKVPENIDLLLFSKENVQENQPKLIVWYDGELKADELEIQNPEKEELDEEVLETENQSDEEIEVKDSEETEDEETENTEDEKKESIDNQETTDAEDNDKNGLDTADTKNDLVAVISGSLPSEGQAPLKVDFKAWNSKNQKEITGYYWEFGDGNSTTAKNPSHTFTQSGDYEIKLTIRNSKDQTNTATIEIKVLEPTLEDTSNADNDGEVPKSVEEPRENQPRPEDDSKEEPATAEGIDYGYDIILIAGQSNTHGGLGSRSPLDAPDEKIKQFGRSSGQNFKVVDAIEPLDHHTKSRGKIGFGLTFAKLYKKEFIRGNREVLIIPCGKNSTGFETDDWNKGNGLYQDAVDRVKHILQNYPGSKLEAILWHQGEQDVYNKKFVSNFDSFIRNLRQELGDENVPFILGGMVPFWVDKLEIRKKHQKILSETPNRHIAVGYADSYLPFRIIKDDDNSYDAIHFDADGQRELGRRYFSQYLRLR